MVRSKGASVGRSALVAGALMVLGCGGGGASGEASAGGGAAGSEASAGASEGASSADAGATSPRVVNPATGHTADAPEISRSLGQPGGVIVFWPRISPRADATDPQMRAIAQAVQHQLEALVRDAIPGRQVDVRPEPERVCPRDGCTAMTVGAVVTRAGSNACAVVAVVSAAGPAPQRLLPWVGEVHLRNDLVPFRDPPEAQMSVSDFASCATVAEHLGDHADAIREAIRASAPPAPQ